MPFEPRRRRAGRPLAPPPRRHGGTFASSGGQDVGVEGVLAAPSAGWAADPGAGAADNPRLPSCAEMVDDFGERDRFQGRRGQRGGLYVRSHPCSRTPPCARPRRRRTRRSTPSTVSGPGRPAAPKQPPGSPAPIRRMRWLLVDVAKRIIVPVTALCGLDPDPCDDSFALGAVGRVLVTTLDNTVFHRRRSGQRHLVPRWPRCAGVAARGFRRHPLSGVRDVRTPRRGRRWGSGPDGV